MNELRMRRRAVLAAAPLLVAAPDDPQVATLVGEARPRVRRDGVDAAVRPAEIVQDDLIVLGLGDQAYPCACDWDSDGDLDLLVGGGYGWPRIVINDGTA